MKCGFPLKRGWPCQRPINHEGAHSVNRLREPERVPAVAEVTDHPPNFQDGNADLLLELVLFLHGNELTIPYEIVRKWSETGTRNVITKHVNADRSLTIRRRICPQHNEVIDDNE